MDDGGQSYFVRVGDDIAVHHILRFNERAATIAAHAAGISPELVHAEPGVMVMRFIEGRTCTADDIREPARLARAVALVKRVHREMPRQIRGPILAFWVFHAIRDYVRTLDEAAAATARAWPSCPTSPRGWSWRSGRWISSSPTTTCCPATSSTTASACG